MPGTFNTMDDLVEAMRLMMPAQPSAEVTPAPTPTSGQCSLDLPLGPNFVGRGQEALAALRADSPDAGADEQILHGLVADELAIASALLDAQAQLTVRLGLLIDEPRKMATVAGVLKEVVAVSNAITRRVEGALAVAANLRSQRHFFAQHATKRRRRGL